MGWHIAWDSKKLYADTVVIWFYPVKEGKSKHLIKG